MDELNSQQAIVDDRQRLVFVQLVTAFVQQKVQVVVVIVSYQEQTVKCSGVCLSILRHECVKQLNRVKVVFEHRKFVEDLEFPANHDQVPVSLRVIQSDVDFLNGYLLLSRFVDCLEDISVGAAVDLCNYVIFVLLVRKLRHVHLDYSFTK